MKTQTSIKDETTEKRKRLALQLVLYVVGLILLAFGITFTINSNLGITPVSSLPFAISIVTGIRMGICVTAVFTSFIALQIIILRKEFRWINLTQILVAVGLGMFVDFARFVVGDFSIPTYAGQFALLTLGIVTFTFGIVVYLDARLILVPVEGLIDAIVQKADTPFHRVKIIMDCTFVALAIAISLIFLQEIQGVREGTVISAVVVGKLMPYFRTFLNMTLRKMKLYDLLYPEQTLK
jgi:uncharacterized membrane protein YczE